MGKEKLPLRNLNASVNGVVLIDNYQEDDLEEIIRATLVGQNNTHPTLVTYYFGGLDMIIKSLFNVSTTRIELTAKEQSKKTLHIKIANQERTTHAVLYEHKSNEFLQTNVTQNSSITANNLLHQSIHTFVDAQQHHIRMGAQAARPTRFYKLNIDMRTHAHTENPDLKHPLNLDFKPLSLVFKQHQETAIKRLARFLAYFTSGKLNIASNKFLVDSYDLQLRMVCELLDINQDTLLTELEQYNDDNIETSLANNVYINAMHTCAEYFDALTDDELSFVPLKSRRKLDEPLFNCMIQTIYVMGFVSVCLSYVNQPIVHAPDDNTYSAMGVWIEQLFGVKVQFSALKSQERSPENISIHTLKDHEEYCKSLIHQVITMSFKTKTNAISIFQTLYQMMKWYQFALTSVEDKLHTQLQNEQFFWERVTVIIDHVTGRVPVLRSILGFWLLKLQGFTVNVALNRMNLLNNNHNAQLNDLLVLKDNEPETTLLVRSSEATKEHIALMLKTSAAIDALEAKIFENDDLDTAIPYGHTRIPMYILIQAIDYFADEAIVHKTLKLGS